MLDGKFSFALYDAKNDRYMAARDPIGVTSLYQGWGKDGSVWFSSEMKAINEDCEKVEPFYPGMVYSSVKGLYRWYQPKWWSEVFFTFFFFFLFSFFFLSFFFLFSKSFSFLILI